MCKLKLRQNYLIIYILVLLCNLHQGRAQYDPGYSQYMLNPLPINPAYAGTRDAITATFSSRQQWLGLDNSISTHLASIQYPINIDFTSFQEYVNGRKRGSNIALSFIYDQVGALKASDINLDYSYILSLSQDVRLSLGLRLTLTNHTIDYNELIWQNPNDPIRNTKEFTSQSLNTGIGAFMYKKNHWYLGLSTPKLAKSTTINGKGIPYNLTEHFFIFASGGAVISLNEDFKLRTTSLLRYSPSTSFSTELSSHLILADKFWLGASYRFKDAFILSLVADIKRNIRVAYSYDFGVSELANYHSGSHEITLIWDFMPRSVNQRYGYFF